MQLVILGSIMPPSSRYGLATLLWLHEQELTENPDTSFSQYVHAGTIMDFVVWLLTGQLQISNHNAANWGGFHLTEW